MTTRNLIPRMIEVRQNYPPPQRLDIPTVVREQFTKSGMLPQIKPGMRIAVGVGSRGINNIAEIAKAVLDVLSSAGAKPFIVPAMGSHGGATPEGQTRVLAEYGVTPESMGVPIHASMEVRKIGEAFSGRDVVFSAAALDADAVIPLNRVKPHTDFHGEMGSGIQKMLAVGFGKQIGANLAHSAAVHEGYLEAFREYARVALENVPVLCGVALIEDQHHETAAIEVLPHDEIVNGERRLIAQATELLPRLPLHEIDLLIVDEMGKEISGTGMDTNVIGREIHGYSSSLRANGNAPTYGHSIRIHRILVCALTEGSKGNGTGLGLADFATARLVNALDLKTTYVNALTSLGVLTPKIPIHFDNDREAVEQALATLASQHPEKLRVVRITNTLQLEKLLVSENCIQVLKDRPGLTLAEKTEEMHFDGAGNLIPF
jgi:Lactate racemase N-terminal domain